MILLSELSRRRIRSIQKLIRVGRNEVVMVMRIDKEKGASVCTGLEVVALSARLVFFGSLENHLKLMLCFYPLITLILHILPLMNNASTRLLLYIRMSIFELMNRLHWSVETSSFSRRCSEMWRQVQQVKSSTFNHATCCRKNGNRFRESQWIGCVAFIWEIRSCVWRIQVINYVSRPLRMCGRAAAPRKKCDDVECNWLGICLWNTSHSDPSVFDGLNIPDDILAETKANIARRLTPQPVKIRADIELTCFSYAGIDAIKRALKAGEAVGTEAIPIKIKLVAPPLFVMLSNATDKNGAIETLEKAITVIDKTIRKDKGSLNVKLRVRLQFFYDVGWRKVSLTLTLDLLLLFGIVPQPKAVSETDDLELNALMERVARENKEVSGDEDSDQD